MKIKLKTKTAVGKPNKTEAKNPEGQLRSTVDYFAQGKFTLHPHQVDGVRWLLEKELAGYKLGGILGDDPGLGKTIQIAALIYGNKGQCPVETTLIVVPVSVLVQWKEVMNYVVGEENVYIHVGNKRAKGSEIKEQCNGKLVCLTTYGVLNQDSIYKVGEKETKGHFAIHNWHRIVLDEGHQIRNPKTKISKVARILSAQYRWILSGTPIQNSSGDIATLMKFIGVPKMKVEDLVSEFMLRRTKEILYSAGLLDRFTIVNHSCEFTTGYEQELYKAIQDQTMYEYSQLETSKGISQMMLLELMIRLRQAAIHPDIALKSLHTKYPETGFDKLKMDTKKIPTKIFHMIEEVKKTKGMSLVFTHFRHEMDYIKSKLRENNIFAECYNGGQLVSERKKILGKFKYSNFKKFKVSGKKCVPIPPSESRPTVLIIQIKAGGVGLNLQKFSNVFFVSPDWNPANEIQAIARAHRIGQDKKVNVHKFTLISNPEFVRESEEFSDSDDEEDFPTTFTTIDERILRTQKNKRTIMEDILVDSSFKFNELFTSYTKNITELSRT